MLNEKDLQHFCNIYTKFKFKNWTYMYIIFLIKLIIRKKKNDIRSRKKTTQSRSITIERIICLEGRNSTIRTHKIESFPPNSRGKNTADHSNPILTIRGAKILSNLAACQSKWYSFPCSLFSPRGAFINYLHEIE